MAIDRLALYNVYTSGICATLATMSWESVHYLVEVLHEARINRRGVFVMGNGGSASTASHLACDLNKNTKSATSNYPRFRVMALSDSVPYFSALANDDGYESVFLEQLKGFMRPDDVVIAISASGNSPNVLRAVEYAEQAGAYIVGWIGYQGGKLVDLVDLPIVVPSNSIEQIEDIHLMLGHMVTQALREYAADVEPVEISTVRRNLVYAQRNGRNGNGKGQNGQPLQYMRGRQNLKP